MPEFPDNLFSISNLCNAGLHCTFTPKEVIAYEPKTKVVKIKGWRDPMLKLWRFLICNLPEKTLLNQNKSKIYSNITVANNAYNLPSLLQVF